MRRVPDVSTAPRDAGGSLRVFRQFLWLGIGSGKMASSRPTHLRVPQRTPPGQRSLIEKSNEVRTMIVAA
jgi:hypothetical protein